MGQSRLLAILEIAENQAQAYTTANEAFSSLEQAHNKILRITTAGATYNVTNIQHYRHAVFEFTAGVALTAVFPDKTVSPSSVSDPNTQRVFVVIARGSSVTVESAGSGGAGSIEVAEDQACMIHQDGQVLTPLFFGDTSGSGGGGSGLPLDLPLYIPGPIPANVTLTEIMVTSGFTLADDFVDSLGRVGVNPSVSTTLTVQRNGSSIGTIVISTAGAFTFTTSGSGSETFSVGQRLSVVSGTTDGLVANLAVTLKGIRL